MINPDGGYGIAQIACQEKQDDTLLQQSIKEIMIAGGASMVVARNMNEGSIARLGEIQPGSLMEYLAHTVSTIKTGCGMPQDSSDYKRNYVVPIIGGPGSGKESVGGPTLAILEEKLADSCVDAKIYYISLGDSIRYLTSRGLIRKEAMVTGFMREELILADMFVRSAALWVTKEDDCEANVLISETVSLTDHLPWEEDHAQKKQYQWPLCASYIPFVGQLASDPSNKMLVLGMAVAPKKEVVANAEDTRSLIVEIANDPDQERQKGFTKEMLKKKGMDWDNANITVQFAFSNNATPAIMEDVWSKIDSNIFHWARSFVKDGPYTSMDDVSLMKDIQERKDVWIGAYVYYLFWISGIDDFFIGKNYNLSHEERQHLCGKIHEEQYQVAFEEVYEIFKEMPYVKEHYFSLNN